MARGRWFRERIEPQLYGARHGLLREHLARYRFASSFARGRVLDAGCGTGYGAQILAAVDTVTEVIGVDCDERAIAHARRYYGGGGITFRRLDLLCGAARAEPRFDTIVAFEVLEHLIDPEGLMETCDLLLAPGGRLLVSTPLGQGRDVPSDQPGHFFQLRRSEFVRLLGSRFQARLFGQKGELIEPWRRGGRYFLMLALCRSRDSAAAGTAERRKG
ncbi:MAG: methyltransferase domain-containing protein [Candidatus Eisenbacteria sp.]|nr:methyltransferase domain-containing protein [Candidatus Eisenbacteria bacterium]